MNVSFSNQQINYSALPTIETIVFRPLHRKYNYVVLLSMCIAVLFLIALGASGFYLPLGEEALVVEYKKEVLFASVLIAFTMATLRIVGVHKKGYAIREHDISYQTGLINQRQITIPFNRVQHVEIYEGFVFRLFGLCRIEFFTAGGNFGDLKIPGLPLAEAEKIKAFVIEQVLPQSKEKEGMPTTANVNTEA